MENRKKIALVTGANTGIGLATVKKLLQQDYFVIGTSKRNNIPIEQDPNFMPLQLELTDEQSILQASKEISTMPYGIDLLINNAGVATDAFYDRPERASFRHTLEVNVTGMIFFTEAVLPNVNDGALIVMLSSAMGLMEQMDINAPAYRISKAAVNVYVKMLAKRMHSQSTKVIALNPGLVRTNMGYPDSPYSPEESADFIFNCMQKCGGTAQFWNAEHATHFPL